MGKSSLLQAAVLPELEAGDPPFLIQPFRRFDDPVANLAAALRRPGLIYKKPPEDLQAEILSLLRRVDERLKNQGRRLLVVLDQFEEFFVFYERSRERLAPLLRLLADLRREQQPLENIRLLLTLRSDYLEDIARVEELPRLEQDCNWKQVGPFTETEARAFLGGGFQEPGLGSELIAAVVRHASELDETRGKVRPVVLNMLGLALAARVGQAGRVLNPREAQRLMLDHVREGLNDPLVRDHAPKVLTKMVTPEGTKERPASATDLARATGLGVPLVQGCLARLNLLGFVRPFDADLEQSAGVQVWEVSHDFVARLLSLILPAWKPSLWSRLRHWIGPLLMGLGIVAVWRGPGLALTGLGIVAVYSLMQLYLDRERARLRRIERLQQWAALYGALATLLKDGTYTVNFVGGEKSADFKTAIRADCSEFANLARFTYGLLARIIL